MIRSEEYLTFFLLVNIVVAVADRDQNLTNHRLKLATRGQRASRPINGSQKSSKSFPFNELLDKGVSLLLGQKNEVIEEISSRFKQFATLDESNDSIGRASTQEILSRSGYNYENHYVVSSDGYITQLIRIVNPLAERSLLKQPPVMMFHGGVIDTSVWVWASAVQHHPEKYPRAGSDGFVTSWNRSLAFVLANDGYDVWLIGTRGSNRFNRGHNKFKSSEPLASMDDKGEKRSHQLEDTVVINRTDVNPKDLNEFRREDIAVSKVVKYWDFSMDEIGAIEIPAQIDRVLQVTGAENVTMITLSLSSMSSLIALASNPTYEKKVHNMVVLGPIINNHGTNNFLRSFQTGLCRALPIEIGNLLFSEIIFSQAIRDFFIHLNKRKDLRNSIVRALILSLTGPSPKFQTHLEQPVIGHIFMPISYKELKHYCQQVVAGSIQRYDHGFVKNKLVYGSISPPKYDLAGINMPNWLVISGENDKLATPKSVEQYINSFKRPPTEHIQVKHYSHMDLLAAVDLDIKVVSPILRFLNSFRLMPLKIEESQAAISRSLESASSTSGLEGFIPSETVYDQLHARNSQAVLEGHLKRSSISDRIVSEKAPSGTSSVTTASPPKSLIAAVSNR